MSTFSPIGSWSSNGMSVCVCGRNELEVCTTLAYPHISSFHTHTHTSPNHFKDSEPLGLKVDIAGRLVTMMMMMVMMMMVMMMMMMGGVKGGVCKVGEPGHVLLCAVSHVVCH